MTSFIAATLSKGASFNSASFYEAGFSRAKFSDQADFTSATFSKEASFTRSTFLGKAYFSGEFNGPTYFHYTVSQLLNLLSISQIFLLILQTIHPLLCF